MDSVQGRARSTRLLGLGRLTVLVLVGCALVAAGSVGAGADALPSTIEASLVFDGVTVVDVEQGRLLPGRRVVITGNRIQAVGPASTVSIPKGALVVDARRKYLIPGLWDLHVHPSSSEKPRADLLPSTKAHLFYPLFLANGVTGIRDAWSAMPLDSMVQWRQEILAGTRVGPPRQLLAGASFGQHYESRDSAAVARIVDSLKAEGANFLKVYPYAHVVAAAARRAGLLFGGHIERDPIEASDSGLIIVDHLNASGGLDQLCIGRRAVFDKCRAVAERFRRNGTWWVPTLSVHMIVGTGQIFRGKKISEEIAKSLGKLASKFWWMDSLPAGNWLRDEMPRLPGSGATPDSLDGLHLIRRAGMPILAGTDVWGTRMGMSLPGFALHGELAILAAEGLTPLEALQAATLNPAKMLHGTDSLGTVAPGKLADLVLLDANPLADITNTTTIRAVVANGRYFDRAALNKVLATTQANGP